MLAFSAGAAAAGLVFGAARLAGMDDPPAAVAEQASTAQPAAAPAPAPASGPHADASPPWRAKGKKAKGDEVPAGILARVASRHAVDRSACPPKPAPAGAHRANPPATTAPDACAARDVESVEIDWHAPATTP
jgi:hypothetical protein